MKKTLALFDFDGTITTRDTLWEIIRYQKGSFHLYTGLALIYPILAAYVLGLASNTRAKEAVLRHFFHQMPLEEFQSACDNFGANRLPSFIRPGALQAISHHLNQGARVLVVSASAENWLEGWCSRTGVECIATRLEVRDGRLTGNIQGKNCHGPEKLVRIRQKTDLDSYEEIYVYGDSAGDKPMLSVATHAFYKPFREGKYKR